MDITELILSDHHEQRKMFAMLDEVGEDPARLEPIWRRLADLAAGGLPGSVAPAGTVLPDADLLDLHGDPTTLPAATAGRPAVVVLYRGPWCPYCDVALATYQTTHCRP